MAISKSGDKIRFQVPVVLIRYADYRGPYEFDLLWGFAFAGDKVIQFQGHSQRDITFSYTTRFKARAEALRRLYVPDDTDQCFYKMNRGYQKSTIRNLRYLIQDFIASGKNTMTTKFRNISYPGAC